MIGQFIDILSYFFYASQTKTMFKDNHLLKNLKIATKLNVLLTVIAVITIFLSGGVLSQILSHNAERVVTDKALVLMETMSAVRNYTSTKVRPELETRLETDYQFLPQTVPAFSWNENPQGS